MTNLNPEDLLTEAEAAKRMGWAVGTLRARRARRVAAANDEGPTADLDLCPPFIRTRGGTRIRYQRAEVERWIERHPEVGVRVEKTIDDTLSQDQVCALIGLSRTQLRERRSRLRDGDKDAAPPHVKAGQEVRYSDEAVRSWAERMNWPLFNIESDEDDEAASA